MPDFGAPVAAGVNVDPNKGLSTLSNLMGLTQQQQAISSKNIGIQQQQTELAGAQAQLPAVQAQAQQAQAKSLQAQKFSQFVQSGMDDQGNSLKGPNGDLDPAKLAMMAGRVSPLAPEIAQGIIQMHAAKVGLQTAATGLTSAQQQMVQGPIESIATNPTDQGVEAARSRLQQLAIAHPEMQTMVNSSMPFVDAIKATQDPKQRTHLASQFGAIYQGGQPVATQPTAGAVNTGAEQQQGTFAPPASGGGFTPSTSVRNQIQPQIYTNAAGQPVFIGGGATGHPAGAAPGAAAGQSTFPATYDVQARGAAATDMTNHFAALNASAQSLPLTTALTKTIQGLAPDAFTDVGGDKKKYMAGVLRAFGGTPTGNAETDTNLLNKAIAQLNISTPAGTDAARQLVEAGQPNSKMDPEAIKEAAGTIAGQVKMNVAERNFLNGTRYENGGAGNPQQYQAGRQAFEANADPRIWQYEDLLKGNKQAAASFISRQPDKAELVQKAVALQQMGFFK